MAKQNRCASQLAHLSFLRTTGKYKVRSQKIYKIILRLDDPSLRPLTQHAKRFSEAAKAVRLIRTAWVPSKMTKGNEGTSVEALTQAWQSH